MSYDPTEWAPQTPGQPPAQPPATPPGYGQTPPSQPPYGQGSNPGQPTYGQPPVPPSSEPGIPPTVYASGSNPDQQAYGQQPPPPFGQQGSNPAQPAYGQPPQYGQSPQSGQQGSNPGQPAYGQPPQYGQPAYGQPPQYGQPAYGQPPQYGQPGGNPAQPAYGNSSPAYPAYGTPGAPADQYAAQQPPVWGAATPPSFIPPASPPQKKKPNIGLIVLIVILILALVGGGGAYLYFSTRPQPVITLSSTYRDGATPVGSSSTTLTVKGTHFSGTSAITFLLDGKPVPGGSPAQSDSNGAVTATLTVTDAWSVGTHTITAKDASDYVTKAGVKVEIVTPGQAGTPGPHGAPTDSATMNLSITITVGTSSADTKLNVKGGKVCSSDDDGVPHSKNGTASNGTTYVETITQTCSGTYQSGKMTYTETASNYKLVYSNGLVCSVNQPFVNRHLEGSFTSNTALNGTYSTDSVTLSCNLGVGNLPVDAEHGTFTGTATVVP